MAKVKCAGPASMMVFLGFELDSAQMIVQLSAEKLERTIQLMREWTSRRTSNPYWGTFNMWQR